MIAPAKSPCLTCPYRRDVPFGIWHEREYAKLPDYDGDIPEQLAAGATGLFLCHQQNGHLCAGWVGCHDMGHNLAVRMSRRDLDINELIHYVSPVPLFASGAEAAAHGRRDIKAPKKAAREKIERLTARRAKQPSRPMKKIRKVA